MIKLLGVRLHQPSQGQHQQQSQLSHHQQTQHQQQNAAKHRKTSTQHSSVVNQMNSHSVQHLGTDHMQQVILCLLLLYNVNVYWLEVCC